MEQTRTLDDHRALEEAICEHIRIGFLPDAPVYFYWAGGKVNVYVFALSPQGHVCRGAYVLNEAKLGDDYLAMAARSIYHQLEIICGETPQTITLSLAKAVEHGSPQE